MVATPGNEGPPLQKRGEPGRRRRRRRESALVWWALFAAWAVLAWWLWSWRLALLGLLAWCLYQLMLVPTVCRVMTRQGFSCRERARGRLFACLAEHQQVKNDALWRLVGMRTRFRGKAEPDPNRETGQVVVSPAVRGRLAQVDRLMILLAAAGTLVTVVGMVYGYTV
jgi:ferric-dicitrate binding protein FerR (iron transport regulator)